MNVMRNILFKRRPGGFTITEVLVAMAIGVMVVGSTTAALIFGIRNWRQQAIINELDINLETAMERLRQDLRLSSVGIGLMAFYPATSTEYTAFSMPLATPGNDGLLQRNSSGKIIWDKTVIYHIRPGNPDQLRRTVFSSRNTNATPTQLYTQLRSTVLASNDAGITAAALSGESATSKVIFSNLVKMAISPTNQTFDGYSPTNYLPEKAYYWGSIMLSNATYDVKFTVVGKNSASTGYKVGIDRLSMSGSGSWREGEIYLPANTHPSTPYYSHTLSGGSVTAELMSAHGANWSGNEQLTYTAGTTASAISNSITLKVQNDLICDTHFDNPFGVFYSNVIRRTESKWPPYLPDFVIAMTTGITWQAIWCADDEDVIPNLVLTNTTPIVNVIYGAGNPVGQIRNDGVWARVSFTAGSSGDLRVENASIMQQSSGTNGVAGTKQVLKFATNTTITISAGDTVWSDWIDYTISKDKTYLVTFDRKNDSAPNSNARAWVNTNAVLSYIDGVPYSQIIGVSQLEVRYPNQGLYRSGIFDTCVGNPAYRQLNWTMEENWSAGDIDIRVRTGDDPDLADASPWVRIGYFQDPTANLLTGSDSPGTGRYLQYEVLFTTDGYPTQPHSQHTNTAYLRDVTINWTGPTGIADLRTSLSRGPDYGIVRATVAGLSFINCIGVDMSIYKKGPWGTNTVTGSLSIRPLNTNK